MTAYDTEQGGEPAGNHKAMTDKTMTLEQVRDRLMACSEGEALIPMRGEMRKWADAITRHLSQTAELVVGWDGAWVKQATAERGEAVAWQYRYKNDRMEWSRWLEWIPEEHPEEPFPKAIGRWDVEYRKLYTAPPPAAGVPEELKRYRFELMGTTSHWGLVPVECEGGEWCKFEDVRRVEFLCRLSATPPPAIDVAAVREVIARLRSKGQWVELKEEADKLARAIGDAK